MSTHAYAPTSHRAPRRGRRRATIVALTLAILGVAAVAFAAVLATAPVQGSVGTADMSVSWVGDLSVVSSDNATCRTQGNQITVEKALTGGSCKFRGKLNRSSDVTAKVQSIELGLPDAWAVKLTAGCGETISTSMTNATTVEWSVTRASEDARGASIPENVGVNAVPSGDYQASACS